MKNGKAATLQNMAARPDQSTWVSANAGSGKTTVLINRVARLLLDGAKPQNILCLTYTKAAATEMQNRLFKRLGEWSMLADEDLGRALGSLGIEETPRASRLRRARTLFAMAIETPGGLKIQTIHSFCSALLRQFPLEAGVSPQFTEMEARGAAMLREEIIEQIASGPGSDIIYAVARHHSGETFESLSGDIVRNRHLFAGSPDSKELAACLGQSVDLSRETIESSVFKGHETHILDKIIPVLSDGGATDRKAAAILCQIQQLHLDALPLFERVFLTGASANEPFCAKIGSFPTRSSQRKIEDVLPGLHEFMKRVETARESRLALSVIEKTRVLHDFTNLFLPAYDSAKERRGMLDFDDLIIKARDLLARSSDAAWVLYKLDGAIDHILVDEAQDTSPVQWEVIELLAQEFTSGEETQLDRPRTIFVVGDKKQSIYSFQGADPGAFDRVKAEFASRLKVANFPLQDIEMEHSFRSSQTILQLVDAVFEDRDTSGFAGGSHHKAFKTNLPGRVDLWPVIKPPDKPSATEWHQPVDIVSPDDPSSELASKVACAIRDMLGSTLPSQHGTARAITPGDIMVLVQRRSQLFHEIIRACKSLNLPVAGADRLRVGAELAVRDIGAMLKFLCTPKDDLSLASALRSPLFGWTEQQLFDLAQRRVNGILWNEIQKRRTEFPDAHHILNDLRKQVGFLRPYDLIERILVRHDGRRKLLARLGSEAEDGIDALLSQAMAYERHSAESLTGFLSWVETDELEIKRQLDSAGDRIRVMTTHGAKGLESPIVFLPDTARRMVRPNHQLANVNGTAFWRVEKKDAAPLALAEADGRWSDAEKAERERLLYVAITRAEQWLIVAAAGKLEKDERDWYSMVRKGMEKCNAVGDPMRIESGNWQSKTTDARHDWESRKVNLPGYFRKKAPRSSVKPKTISPSGLGGAKTLPGGEELDRDAAMRKGRQIHSLLEFLLGEPKTEWPQAARQILHGAGEDATDSELDALLTEASNVLCNPSLSHLFGKNALAEVPISASVEILGGKRIHGHIDRLVVSTDRVLAVDFKTNSVVPKSAADCPAGFLRQMGAYAQALGEIYPDRHVQTAILWTTSATLMELPNKLVTDALSQVR